MESAQRELLEETGLRASEWIYLDTLYTSNCFTNEVGHIFLARELHQDIPQPEHTEQLQIKKVPLIEAYHKVLTCEIKDAMAIIGIMRVYQWLNTHHLL